MSIISPLTHVNNAAISTHTQQSMNLKTKTKQKTKTQTLLPPFLQNRDTTSVKLDILSQILSNNSYKYCILILRSITLSTNKLCGDHHRQNTVSDLISDILPKNTVQQ